MKVFFKVAAVVVGLLMFGCASPTGKAGGGSVADVGNAIIGSLSVDNVTPAKATASRSLGSRSALALVSGDLGFADQELNNGSLQPPNVAGILIRVFKSVVGSSAIPLNTVTSFPAVTNVSTGPNAQPAAIDVGASQIKIVPSASRVMVYWKTTFDFKMGPGPAPMPTQIQFQLENFTAGTYTDYKKITTWILISGFTKVKGICDFSTGDSVRYVPPSGFSGEVTVVGKANGGVYLRNVRSRGLADFVDGTAANTTLVSAFGDGHRLVISTNESWAPYTSNVPRYLINDADVAVGSVSAPDKTFLDTGLNGNPALAASWDAVSGSGTEYYRLFGAGTSGVGDFDTELTVATALP